LAQGSKSGPKAGSGKNAGGGYNRNSPTMPPGYPGATGSQPGMMMPPGMQGMMPGMTGTGRTKKKSTKKDTKPGSKEAAEAEEVDPNELPKGYTPPPPPPDWLTTEDEWVYEPWEGTEKEKDKARKIDLSNYRNLITKGEFGGDGDKKLVERITEWRLSQMTRKENREQAYKRREEIYKDMRDSGTSRNAKRDVRKYIMQVVADKSPKLFNYHFVARLNGAILLADMSELNEVDGDGRNNPPVRCIRAMDSLVHLLDDPDDKGRKQPDAVRVWGVEGLVRIGTVPDLKPAIRTQVGEVLARNLTSSNSDHDWLQWRLASAVGSVGVAYNLDKRPFAPEALASVLIDTKRSWLVRAEAAQSLGRLPLDRDVDLSLVAHEVAELAQQMGDAYLKNPEDAMWKLTFLKLYLAFKPGSDEDATAGRGLLTQVSSKGSLAAYKKTVQEAFDLVLPIVKKVLTPPQNIEDSLSKLKDWLKNNPRVADKDKPIHEAPKSSAPAEPATSGAGATAG